MLGAIIGDMVGSVYELRPLKSKEFDIMNMKSRMTDDSLLTMAVCKVLMNNYPIKYDKDSVEKIQDELRKEFVRVCKAKPFAGYSDMFFQWCRRVVQGNVQPYNSFGNGAAMRISSVGWVSKSEEEVKTLSRIMTGITHNHPEGLKGAEAVAMAIYLSLSGKSKKEIEERMIEYYPEIKNLDFNDLVENYKFNASCQKSVPQAIYCFLISNGLEDTLRNCVAIGGDCDTISAIAGSIAEAFYQKDKLSSFEKDYIYYMIDPEIEEFIISFYKIIWNNKFNRNIKK